MNADYLSVLRKRDLSKFHAKRGSPHGHKVEAIRKLIIALGGKFWLTSQGHRLHGSAGIPDIYVHIVERYIPERIDLRFWVEVKCGRDKLSPAQKEFVEAERACGGSVVIGGVTEVLAHLKEHGVRLL